jgi:hypothetical protein
MTSFPTRSSSSLNYLLSSSRFLGGGGGVRKEVVFCQLPTLLFQIPGRRRRSEKGGCLLLGGRLLSITYSPVPDSWEEAAELERRLFPPRRSSSVNYLLSSSRFLGGGGGVRKEVVSSSEVVFCQLPALQFQIPGRRQRGEEGGRLLLGGRLLSITCSPVPDS